MAAILFESRYEPCYHASAEEVAVCAKLFDDVILLFKSAKKM